MRINVIYDSTNIEEEEASTETGEVKNLPVTAGHDDEPGDLGITSTEERVAASSAESQQHGCMKFICSSANRKHRPAVLKRGKEPEGAHAFMNDHTTKTNAGRARQLKKQR